MRRFFDSNYGGAPFALFGWGHLTALGLIVLVALAMLPLRRVPDRMMRRTFRGALALWLVCWDLGNYAWRFGNGLGSIQTDLPLHMCAITVWLCVITLLTGNVHAYEFAFFLGLGGATQGLITPEIGHYGFPHFRALQSFAVHGGIVLAALYMTLVEGYRPTARSLGRVIVWMGLYAAAIFPLNLVLGSNYLFIAAKPDFPTLLDNLAPWPWYVPQLALIAFTVACALYLPFWIGDLRARSSGMHRRPREVTGADEKLV